MPKLNFFAKKYYQYFWLLLLVFLFTGCQETTNNNIPLAADKVELIFVKDNQITGSDSSGQGIVNLSMNNKINFAPLWIKKGSTILFISELNGFYEVWQKNIISGESELLWGSKKKPQFINASPDSLWLTYSEEQACFLLNIKEKKASRISNNCQSFAWAPKDKALVFVTTDKLYRRSFNVKTELDAAQEIYAGAIKSPIFLDDQNLALVTANPDTNPTTYDLYKLSLSDKNLSRLTSLYFPAADNVEMQLSPDKKNIMANFNNHVWLVTLTEPNLAKEVLANAELAVWNGTSDGFYYSASAVDENNEMVHNIYRASLNGLNKEKIISQAENPVSLAN